MNHGIDSDIIFEHFKVDPLAFVPGSFLHSAIKNPFIDLETLMIFIWFSVLYKYNLVVSVQINCSVSNFAKGKENHKYV